jgi:hypothetical protein
VTSQSLEEPPPAAAACPLGYYYDGSGANYACVRCPLGSATLSNASTSINDCMVPPGYYVKAPAAGSSSSGGEMVPCPTTTPGTEEEGYYRAGWKSFSEVTSVTGDGKDVCSKCGEGILSRPMDDDESSAAAPGSKVASSPASCCEYTQMKACLVRNCVLVHSDDAHQPALSQLAAFPVDAATADQSGHCLACSTAC